MSVNKLILIKELICHQTRLVPTPHRFLLYYYLIYLFSLHACIVDRNENIVCHLSLQSAEIARVSKTVSDFKICRREEISLQCFFFSLREFLLYLQRYKSFFAALPEMMCEGETVVDGSTCWVGNDLAER